MDVHATSSLGWRSIVIAIGLMAAIVVGTAWTHAPYLFADGSPGTVGGKVDRPGGDGFRVVREAPADSPLARAGIVAGDEIRYPHRGFSIGRGYRADQRVTFDVRSAGVVRPVEIVMGAGDKLVAGARVSVALAAISATIALILGMAIGLRPGVTPPVRAFVVALLLIAMADAMEALPMGVVSTALHRSFSIVYTGFYFGFLFFCLTYPEDVGGKWRQRLRRLLVPIAVASVGYGVAGTLVRNGWIAPFAGMGVHMAAYATASVAISLLGLFLGWRDSRGPTRTRMGWIALSMGLIFAAAAVTNIVYGLGFGAAFEGHPWIMAGAATIGMVGLSYALLRHRLFDVGFAINRVLVFGAASGGLLLVFGLLEWVAHKVVHFESAFLDACLALAVFLAFHKVHHYADKAVERLFFHEWHRREQELRAFVHEARYILGPEALLSGFGRALERFTGGASWAIYLAEGDRYRRADGDADAPESLHRDHAACVALRAREGPQVLDAKHAAGRAELALPLAHRHELEGLVLVAQKPSGLPYRPDEVQLLGEAAHDIALDLHALEVERLRRELERADAEVLRARAEASAFRSVVETRLAAAE